MEVYIKNCREYKNTKLTRTDIYIKDGEYYSVSSFSKNIPIIDGEDIVIAPSFVDLHVHLREPGFPYKETIKSGTAAAARGGFTTIATMPNLDPVPDSIESLNLQLELIKRDAVVEVLPYASITKKEKGKELSDIEGMSEYCMGYSDDGNGVQNRDIMKKAMKEIAKTGRILAAHVEDNSLLLPNGTVHSGIAATKYGLIGMPSETEYTQLERDIELVRETGVRYHLCHISTKESVEIVRKAKREGLDVTAEVTPHHFSFSDKDIIEDSGRFKMNPPLRSEEDRLALLEGIKDGTIDIIATDHAPHSEEEKAKGLEKSAFGTVGLETAFSAGYTFLVGRGVISLEKLLYLMTMRPREILRRTTTKDFVVLNLKKEYTVDPYDFLSFGKATPFEGVKLRGDIVMTVKDSIKVYDGGFFGE